MKKLKEIEKYYGDILEAVKKDVSKNIIETKETLDIIELLYSMVTLRISSLQYDMIPENYIILAIDTLKNI